MANLNTAGFGLIAAGTIGSTPATQGQGKYYIETAYATSIFQGASVLMKAGYVNQGQASCYSKKYWYFQRMFLQRGYDFKANLGEPLGWAYRSGKFRERSGICYRQ